MSKVGGKYLITLRSTERELNGSPYQMMLALQAAESHQTWYLMVPSVRPKIKHTGFWPLMGHHSTGNVN